MGCVKAAQIIKYYGSPKATADAFGISLSAVCQWGERVPMLRAYQFERLSRGYYRVNPADYTQRMPPKYPKLKHPKEVN